MYVCMYNYYITGVYYVDDPENSYSTKTANYRASPSKRNTSIPELT